MAEVIQLKWEYRHLFINLGEVITDKLNELGSEGWECFSMNYTNAGIQCILKRPAIYRKDTINDTFDKFKTTGVDEMKFKVE